MKALVVGSGGREHALVWKLRQSEGVQQVYCVPGNAGIAMEASCIPGDIASSSELVALAETLGADFTIVGPEAPLVNGLVDAFAARKLPIVGPSKFASQLEGSKLFAKEFMRDHSIPSADFALLENAADIDQHISRFGFPVALKADGLAAGKGVVLAKNEQEARETAQTMLAGRLVGDAGRRIVLEQFLQGEEVSFIVLSDGGNYLVYPPTQDHKPVFDNDEGPNTGGMGAYCDPAILSNDLRSTIIDTVVEPTLDGLRKAGHPFRGFLYCGLMMTSEGPQVLEYNVRMGDPETQPLMFRMRGNFAELMSSAARGELQTDSVSWSPGPTACVVLCSEGYPGEYPRGRHIEGVPEAERNGAKVFHAGTRLQGGELVTAGGRVLGVTAGGDSLRQALETAYEAVAKIHFEGMHYRKDIGSKGLIRQA